MIWVGARAASESETPVDPSSLFTRVRDVIQGLFGVTDDVWIDAAVGAMAVGIAILAWSVARLLVVGVIQRIIKRTRTTWDDALVENHLFSRLAHLAPASVFHIAATVLADPGWQTGCQRLALAYFSLTGLGVALSVLDATVDVYRSFETSRRNPIKGFVDGAKIIVIIVGLVLFIAAILGRDPWGLVAGIGALMAVLLLVFKDSILGLVASIQIIANDLVHIGDWIEVPSHNADGDVVDVSLTTIKVRNFDKTITTVPTYALTSGSFKNWRGMSESGGRRIKRSIHLDMTSVCFCDDAMLDRLERIELISDYVKSKRAEIAEDNDERGIDMDEPANGRRITNLGTFRAYLRSYTSAHPLIHPGMTRIVRQLAPSAVGLPIELYFFSSNTAWVDYENLQADVFDHIIAILPRFGLRVFQNPSGADFASLIDRDD